MLLVGVVIGLAAAAASTRALRSLLFGVGALDSATFAAVAGGMLLVGLLAAYLPAPRVAGGSDRVAQGGSSDRRRFAVNGHHDGC